MFIIITKKYYSQEVNEVVKCYNDCVMVGYQYKLLYNFAQLSYKKLCP